MAHDSKSAPKRKPDPITISRVFDAPREIVFKAWSTAEHIKRWFSPEVCSVPEAEIEFRPGGAFVVCMRMPNGTDHWARGKFTEVSPVDRLAFTLKVEMEGAVRFTAKTHVAFEMEGAGTRMTVRQVYELHDPTFLGAPAGALEGWRTTLDKLEKEVARIKAAPPRNVVHGAFALHRSFDAAPAQVFRALSDKAAKARWFTGPDGFVALEREMDFRPGGCERLKGRHPSGLVTTFDAVYFDVVPNERLVYTYEMHVDERKISVSLATMQLEAEGAGTRLTLTEQGAFLDGYDDAGSREQGTRGLLDRLAESLKDSR